MINSAYFVSGLSTILLSELFDRTLFSLIFTKQIKKVQNSNLWQWFLDRLSRFSGVCRYGNKMERMNQLLVIVFFFIVCISCENMTNDSDNRVFKDSIMLKETLSDTLSSQTDTVKNPNNIQKTNSILKIKETSNIVPKKTKYDNFEVVYLDYIEDRLQRVFVCIDTGIVYDTSMIQSIVCEIKTLFDIDNKSNISFFSDKKYADYKDNLFFHEGQTLSEEEYDNWNNYYYLAEFEFETNEYSVFPACTKYFERRRIINIECK